jgi:allophanate hydrolase
MDISTLQRSYREGTLTPTVVVERAYAEIAEQGERPVWISLVPKDQILQRAKDLEASGAMQELPLYGIPFAVKDNFDVAGMPTTAACPEFARIAVETAAAVQRLIDAGAILIGKTNMDQFATGLVGTRTPYGVCSSVINSEYVSGGSSSGSAVAVARGIVSFALGTDTAGSGRVPAAFNQLVGLKPTRGWVSTHGLVPACRTLDCVSVFAETCTDAQEVFRVLRGFDAKDPYSRASRPGEGAAPWSGRLGDRASFRFGVPFAEQLEFFGDQDAEQQFCESTRIMEAIGGELVRFDYTPFHEAAELLYMGPWVAERLAAIECFLTTHPDALDATVGGIISFGSQQSAVEAFKAQYELERLKRATEVTWDQLDVLLLPTAGTHYKIDDVHQDPVRLNSNLGYYTNFVNLLDLAAVAVPAGLKPRGLPFGVTVIGRAFTDEGLLQVADRLHRALTERIGNGQRSLRDTPALNDAVPFGCLPLAVVGAHLSGEALNWQLTERKARLMCRTRTSGDYRLYAIPNTAPPKPGLQYDPGYGGDGIDIEIWAIPEDTVGSFLALIPPPLGLGTIRVSNGSMVKGFLCEPVALLGAEEITHLGGWRNFVRQSAAAKDSSTVAL